MNPVLMNPGLHHPLDDDGEVTVDTMARLYHRINNTLVPILAYADLGERVSQDEKVQAYCAKIHQSACDLRALIESASESHRCHGVKVES